MKRPDLSRIPRNAIAIAAIIVVLPIILATQIYPNIKDQQDTDATRPRTAAPGRSVEFAELMWSLGSVTKLTSPPRGKPLPPHTEAWVVTVDITKNGSPTADRGKRLSTCGVRLREDERYWTDGPVYWRPDRGVAADCAGPGPLQTAFLLPAGANPDSVDIVMQTRYPDFVRMKLR